MTGRAKGTARSCWFHLLLRLFPDSDSAARKTEMIESLELGIGARVSRESVSLVWAAAVSWRRYLRTRAGIRQAGAAGALVLFAFIVTVGPIMRLRVVMQPGGPAPGLSSQQGPHVMAVACLVVATLLLVAPGRTIPRLGACLFASVGMVATALANRVGEFQLLASVLYEARYLGATFVLAVIAKPLRPWRWPAAALGAMGAVTAVAPIQHYQQHFTRSYFGAIKQVQQYYPDPGSNNWLQAAVLAAMVIAFVLPFFAPASAAFALPAMIALLVLPSSRFQVSSLIVRFVAIAMYLAAVAVWNYRRPEMSVSVDRTRRGRRLDLSVEWRPDRGRN